MQPAAVEERDAVPWPVRAHVVELCVELNENRPERTYVSFHRVNHAEASRLAEALRGNTHVTRMHLQLEDLTLEATTPLVSFIESSPNLTELELHGVPTRRGQAVAERLLIAVKNNPSIRSLLLDVLIGFGADAVSSLLRGTHSLVDLQIECGTPVPTEADVRKIALAFGANNSLQNLTLDRIQGDLLAQILEQMVGHRSLRYLRLDGIGDDGTEYRLFRPALRRMLSSSSTLEELSIEESDLGDGVHVMQAVVEGLAQNRNITTLSFKYCDMTLACATRLRGIFGMNSTLSTVDLEGSDLEATCLVEILDGLNESASVVELTLAGHIGNQERLYAEAVSNFLRQNRRMSRLRLVSYRLGSAGAAEIAEGLRDSQSLIELRLKLSWNRIGREGLVAIAAAACHNQSLQTLELIDSYDEEAVLMASMLQQDPALAELKVGQCSHVGFAALMSSLVENSNVEHLSIYSVDLSGFGESIPDLIESFSRINHLKRLTLWLEGPADDNGLDLLMFCFESNHSLLEVNLNCTESQESMLAYYCARNRVRPLLSAPVEKVPHSLLPAMLEAIMKRDNTTSVVFDVLRARAGLALESTLVEQREHRHNEAEV